MMEVEMKVFYHSYETVCHHIYSKNEENTVRNSSYSNSHIHCGLDPCTPYNCSVTAISFNGNNSEAISADQTTGYGQGNLDFHMIIRKTNLKTFLLSSAPGAPTNLLATPISVDTVFLTWGPPDVAGQCLVGYNISWVNLDDPEDTTTSGSAIADLGRVFSLTIQMKTMTPNPVLGQLSKEIPNLLECTNYEFSLNGYSDIPGVMDGLVDSSTASTFNKGQTKTF